MIKLVILGSADIAFNRFIPALQKSNRFQLLGVASRGGPSHPKAKRFTQTYQVPVFENYEQALDCAEAEAFYLPLPPALHAEYGKKVLERGRHLYMEKPFTTHLKDTLPLLELSQKRDLAVMENYMFRHHGQLKRVKEMIKANKLGRLQLVRGTFTFPFRGAEDFRYHPSLGGGALLDCGGYTLALAQELLDEPQIVASNRFGPANLDLYGSVTLKDKKNCLFQGFFSMDSQYQCALEILGTKGRLTTDRIFTAPPGQEPKLILQTGSSKEEILLPEDDHFLRALDHFADLIEQKVPREEERTLIARQSQLMSAILDKPITPAGGSHDSLQ